MKKMFFLAMCITVFAGSAGAQTIEDARKSIDAEQFEKAKRELKSVIKAKPKEGRAFFFLGTIYLQQNQPDSAKVCFEEGKNTSDGAKLNLIGLGQWELYYNNIPAA